MNNQFKNTKLRLTLWYLAILMIVSIVFSIVVFISLNAELLRNARREQQKIVADQLKIVLPKPLPDPDKLRKELVDPPLSFDIKQNYNNLRNQLFLYLFLANGIVLGLSTSASYILAGKTLKPIEQMINDQKKFIANASHELRTPLTTLKTAIEVTLKMGPVPYNKVKSILESNLEDVNSLEKLTNNLLIIEKYSKSTERKAFDNVQMDKLVAECVSVMKPKAQVNKIKISLNTTPLIIKGDRLALEEMINNLLDNALKYNKVKGKIDISLFARNNNLYLKVEDSGIGIGKIDIKHIFERFYRSDNSRSKSNIAGYGLGLSIVSEIVKQHKGIISVNSIEDKGTTFIVQIPLKHARFT